MTLAGTNTYLVGEGPCWVVDPGPADQAHVEAVRAAAAERGGIAGVVLTHSHADHSGAVEALGAPLEWGEPRATSESDWALAPAASAAVPGDAPGEGRRVGPFEAIPTPGHARDHACFRLGGVLFCGDLVLGEGSSIVPPAALGGSLADYMASLERIAALDVELMAPGHGPWITEPAARIAEYVAHRHERERRLRAALDAGASTTEELLDAAWGDVPAPLRPAAALALQAHLEKLAAEGVPVPDTSRG